MNRPTAWSFVHLRSAALALLWLLAAACQSSSAPTQVSETAAPTPTLDNGPDGPGEALDPGTDEAQAPERADSPDEAGDARLEVITGEGIEVMAIEDVAALTAEGKAAPKGTLAAVPRKQPSPYTLLVNPGEFETLIEVHPDSSATPLLTYELDTRILRLQWNLERSEQEQVQDLIAMLKELTQEMQAAFSPSGFSLQADFKGYPSYADRLAHFAAKDAAFRGVAKALRKNADGAGPAFATYMVNVTRREHLMPELDAFFAAFALQLEVDRVEGCISSRNHVEGAATFRRKRRLWSESPVPLGCKLFFKLVPMQPSDAEEADEVEETKPAAEETTPAAESGTEAPRAPKDASTEDGTDLAAHAPTNAASPKPAPNQPAN